MYQLIITLENIHHTLESETARCSIGIVLSPLVYALNKTIGLMNRGIKGQEINTPSPFLLYEPVQYTTAQPVLT